jgi:hypothetical protein
MGALPLLPGIPLVIRASHNWHSLIAMLRSRSHLLTH